MPRQGYSPTCHSKLLTSRRDGTLIQRLNKHLHVNQAKALNIIYTCTYMPARKGKATRKMHAKAFSQVIWVIRVLPKEVLLLFILCHQIYLTNKQLSFPAVLQPRTVDSKPNPIPLNEFHLIVPFYLKYDFFHSERDSRNYFNSNLIPIHPVKTIKWQLTLYVPML